MILCLQIAGILLMMLAALHLGFPRYFRWREEFASVNLINRQMMYFHAFFLAFVLLLMGLLCLLAAEDLVRTPLGHKIDLGLAFFWLVRLFVQFFGYSSEHWRRKRFEMLVHVIFSLLWIYLTVVFLLVSGILGGNIIINY